MLNSIYPIPGRFGRLLLIFLRGKIQKRLRVDIFYNKSTGRQPSEPSEVPFFGHYSHTSSTLYAGGVS